MHRRILFKALVGSHNYNLATEKSDKDYKVLVLPTFEDLYSGTTYSEAFIGEKEDLDFHDVRKLVDLFFKSNINFIEVLETTDLILPDGITLAELDFLEKLYLMKDDIFRMNLPHLFNACGGMHLNKMKALHKGTDGTQYLVDLYNYDTKQALHAYRVLDFIVRFADTGFKDFKKAITYNDEERKFMLDIKNGHFLKEDFELFVKSFHDNKFAPLKSVYHSVEPDLKTRDKLMSMVMELVKNHITK